MTNWHYFQVFWIAGYLIWLCIAYSNIQANNAIADHYQMDEYRVSETDYARTIILSIVCWPLFIIISLVMFIKDKYFSK